MSIKKIVKNCFWEFAKGKRKCARNKTHKINSGVECFVTKENFSAKSYCLDCAKKILIAAKEDLESLFVKIRDN